MSKIKEFKLELFDEKTEGVETITVHKFVSTGDLYETIEVAERFENPELTFKEQIDTAMGVITSVFGGQKTSDGKKVDAKLIKERLSSEDFMTVAQEIIMIKTGQDPNWIPPVAN
ncbi:phage tail assembly chaperone G [Vagococcus salmoninarum]|uniref:phage tail assembly chaperone G n=1 Tax=Vagococcus salmoninarum TaxID=2739 RepID=UPI0028D6B137|nr:hypothetical protein [Vagococcus salmoninarum]